MTWPRPPLGQMLVATLSHATCNIYSPKGFGAWIHENATHIVLFIVYEIHFLLILSKCSIRSKITCQNMQGLRHSVWAIDNFVYMKTSSKWRPGPILENLYAPQNFVPAFLSRLFGPSSPSSPERGPTELPFEAISNGVGCNVSKNFVFEVELRHLN